MVAEGREVEEAAAEGAEAEDTEAEEAGALMDRVSMSDNKK